MAVAIRKRSWEEHVTHPSGLQYSYDDLDLVCCHGVDSEGIWLDSEALKQGRRTRCVSMPECCQLPSDDSSQTPLVESFAVKDVNESAKNNEDSLLKFQESVLELVAPELPKRNFKSAQLSAPNTGISSVFYCYSNSTISSVNTYFATDNQTMKTLYNKGVIGIECRQDCIFSGDVLNSLKEKQYISIPTNKGPPCSESADEQPGKLPTHQQTKESHTESYSRSPEISEVTLNRGTAAEQEPQSDCADVEGTISTSDQACGRELYFTQQNPMEGGNELSLPNKSLEQFLTFTIEEECDNGFTQSQSTDFIHKSGGQNELETKSDNEGLNNLRTVQGEPDYANRADDLDQADDCEIYKDMVNLPTSAQQELQTHCPEVERIISTSDQAAVEGPIFVLQNSADSTEENTSVKQPIVTLSLDPQYDKTSSQSWSTVPSRRLDGLNDSEILNENPGHPHHSRNIQADQGSYNCAVALDHCNDCETLNQTLVEPHNVAATDESCPHVEESAEKKEPPDTYQNKVINQCLTLIKTAEQQSTGNIERESILKSTIWCADHQNVKTSLSRSVDVIVQNPLPKEWTVCKDEDVPLNVENNSSKHVAIPEIRLVKADDYSLVKATEKTVVDIIENPVYNIHLDNEYKTTEQQMNPPFLSKEVSELLHGNQTSCLSESPCSEVADGHNEHRSPGNAVSAMGELDKAVFSAVSRDKQLSSSDIEGTHETENQKEDSVVKVRMRRHEHARLDSMVLLLMKLDQLDQEIENALSTTSSMTSSPIPNRRHHLVTNKEQTPAALLTLPLPNETAAFSSRSAKICKPKSGSLSPTSEKKKAAACKTYFETVRRSFRYTQPENTLRAEAAKQYARSRASRRLLKARQSVLADEEVELWKSATVYLMSDEEMVSLAVSLDGLYGRRHFVGRISLNSVLSCGPS